MFSETNVCKMLTGVIIIVVIGILIFVGVTTSNSNADNQNAIVIPTETPITTETPVVTERPPIYVIRVTPTPSVVTPTSAPTQVPAVEPTEAPTLEPTAKPTEAPTLEPTAVPTEEPTQEPTAEPTEEPTNVPVVVVPTLNPVTQYVQIEKEMATLTMLGGIYPDYKVEAKNDLYDYIYVEGVEPEMLFALLRIPFEQGIAGWTAMEFDSSKDTCEQLDFALDSSICDICGRVIIEERQLNKVAVCELFEEIERNGEFATTNQLLLDYLNNYTVRNPDNPNERWIISCKGH